MSWNVAKKGFGQIHERRNCRTGGSLVLLTLAFSVSLFFGCAGGDRVRLNDEIPIDSRSDLSPPIVHEPIYDCSRAVKVTGFVPNAQVRVYSNLVDVVGQATPHFGFTEIQLTRPLAVGESITATQTVIGIESAHSIEPVEVSSLPDFSAGIPPRPTVGADLYECGRVVPVGGLIPGVKVSVDEDGTTIGSANAADTGKNVFTAPLNAGGVVTATQAACADIPGKQALESLPSPGVIVKPVPDPFRPPVLDESTVIVGNNSVTLRDLYVGAKVTVFNGSTALASGYANASSNWVPLPDPLQASWSVRGEQELCGTSASSDPVDPKTELPAPRIVGPVCDTDEYVRVQGTIINAAVVLLRNGAVAGLAGATPGELLLPRGEPFVQGDILTVRQYMGENVSAASNAVTVCACSDAWLRERIDEVLSGAAADLKPVACGTSSLDLFQNTDPFEVLQVTLRADFTTINEEPIKADAKSPGKLTYIDPITTLPVSVNCTVEARGKSRFQHCEWRPLRLRFASDPTGTLFQGTGKVIKIVTHCEWISSPVLDQNGILPGTPAEDRRRLMQEFALYEVLATMGTTALETRLALITYEDPSGTPLATEYAFFREREKRAAQRCGFQRLEKDEGDLVGLLPPNITSDFQVQFHHKFLFSRDYHAQNEHNVIRMSSPSGEEYYMPYDFDLSGVIHPSYWKNKGWSIEENGEELISWLESWPDPNLARVQVAFLLQYEDEMRQRVDHGLVDAPGKARLQAWLEDHIRRLKCFLN